MIRILAGLAPVAGDQDESGITMKSEIRCYCYLPVFLSSSLYPPLFLRAYACLLYSFPRRSGNKVWVLETAKRPIVLDGRPE